MYEKADKAKTVFQYLAKIHKLNNTKERIQLIEAICSINAHFDIKELTMLLKKQNLSISKSTIYRTINLLVKLKILQKLSFDDACSRYEYAVGYKHHDHLICIQCDRIIEFVDKTIEERQSLVCKQHGFTETEHTLQIFGFCNKCKPLV